MRAELRDAKIAWARVHRPFKWVARIGKRPQQAATVRLAHRGDGPMRTVAPHIREERAA